MHNVIFWGADVVFNSIIHCKLGIIIDQGEQLRTRTGRRGGGGVWGISSARNMVWTTRVWNQSLAVAVGRWETHGR